MRSNVVNMAFYLKPTPTLRGRDPLNYYAEISIKVYSWKRSVQGEGWNNIVRECLKYQYWERLSTYLACLLLSSLVEKNKNVKCTYVIYICSPTRYTKCFNDLVYSPHMLAQHVSDLTGPSSGPFYKLYVQIWYVVLLCVLLDTSSRYEVVGSCYVLTVWLMASSSQRSCGVYSTAFFRNVCTFLPHCVIQYYNSQHRTIIK